MDVTINKDLLVREFGLARRLGERKATIPVYGYARVEADFDQVHISATDGEASLETMIPAMAVGEPGVALVPIRTVHEMARAAAAEGVRLSTDDGRLLVQSGGFKSRLGILPVEQFPNIPEAPTEVVQLRTALMRASIDKTRFVLEASVGKTGNGAFHGAKLKLSPKQVEVVATDGRRIAHVQWAGVEGEPSDVLVPRKALEDLGTILALDNMPETFGYATADGKAHFIIDQRRFVTRLVDALYPDYARAMPKVGPPSADVDRDTWLSLLRRVMLVSTVDATKVGLALRDKSMTAVMESTTVGSASEALDIALTGDGWETAFDVQYLAEFLAASHAGTIRFCQAAPNKGARLQSIEGDLEYTYVLMPMS